MITVVPTGPDAGENPEIPIAVVNVPELVAVLHPVDTEMVPLVAPGGTVTLRVVEVLDTIDAVVPLNFTVF
jgi:hypothetical protein